jgi:PhnB protein
MLGDTGRPGHHTVAPYLVTVDVDGLVAFVTQAFAAEETFRTRGPAGGLHVEVRIGDSIVMIGGGPGGGAFPAMLHLYVQDSDAVYRRALDAGATSIAAPADDGFDRRGGVQDRFGNQWFIATHLRDGRGA